MVKNLTLFSTFLALTLGIVATARPALAISSTGAGITQAVSDAKKVVANTDHEDDESADEGDEEEAQD